MGKDEIRVGVGLVLLAAALTVLGPVASPWNFLFAAVLLLSGLVTISWNRIARRAPRSPSWAALEEGIRMAQEEFRSRRSALEQQAGGAEGDIAVIDLTGNPPNKKIKIEDAGIEYVLNISRAGGTNVWFYGNHPSIKSLAYEPFAKRGEIVDVTALRRVRDALAVKIGERVFATTTDKRVIQVLLLSVRYYNDGDDHDEARVCYRVYAPGKFLIPAL
jgi:hypothetical protein